MALSYTPFISTNPVVRILPPSQIPRQPYRGLHPTHQAQDSDTLSRPHSRHTTNRSNEESPSNFDGFPTMQAPAATRRPTSGQDGSTE